MLCNKCKQDLLEGVACGQAFTQWICKKCGQIGWHHNTYTPNICPACSEEYNLCEQCGEKIDEK